MPMISHFAESQNNSLHKVLAKKSFLELLGTDGLIVTSIIVNDESAK